jgi:hypothetical protein
VIASQHKKERVYVTLNGYRWDDFNVYVYKSEDFGKTWKSIASNIPSSPVNVIREDPKNDNILYLGTDNGAYVSFNRGEYWETFSKGLPNVAVHDIVVQADAKELLLGTHGRSIYKANISALQEYEAQNSEAITLFDINSVRHSKRWGSSRSTWSDPFEPSVTIPFYSTAKAIQGISILSENETVLQSFSVDATEGFNYIDYDLTLSKSGSKTLMKENTKVELNKAQNNKYYLPKGVYTIKIGSKKTTLEIK